VQYNHFVGIVIAAVGAAGLVVAVSSVDCRTDLRGAVTGAAAGGCLLACLEVGGEGDRGSCEQHGGSEDGLEEHIVCLLFVQSIERRYIWENESVIGYSKSTESVVGYSKRMESRDEADVSCGESKLVFDFLPVDGRPTLLDSQKSESHAPRSYYLIVHWREVKGTKVTSILARSCAARG
jgi:hypothetical protein